MPREAVDRGTTAQIRSRDPYFGIPVAYGTGFALQTEERPFGPATSAFGHNGAGGSVHGAWPLPRTGFSYIPRSLWSFDTADTRAPALLAALHEAI